jgi:hypothetical protein
MFFLIFDVSSFCCFVTFCIPPVWVNKLVFTDLQSYSRDSCTQHRSLLRAKYGDDVRLPCELLQMSTVFVGFHKNKLNFLKHSFLFADIPRANGQRLVYDKMFWLRERQRAWIGFGLLTRWIIRSRRRRRGFLSMSRVFNECKPAVAHF